MEIKGEYKIAAPRDKVFAALNDQAILQACIPGCETMEKTDATHFNAAARLKIGPVSATFKGRVELSELDPPKRCVLKGEGQGGVAGFARGEALPGEEGADAGGGAEDGQGASADAGQRLAGCHAQTRLASP